MYYGGMDSLNELAALSDGEAAMAGLAADVPSVPVFGPTGEIVGSRPLVTKAAKPSGPSMWTPEFVQSIGQTLTKGIQDVGTLNIQRIYAQKGLMIPGDLNQEQQAAEAAARAAAARGRQAPWPAWSKWLIAGGAILLVGTLVYKATRGAKSQAADFQI